MFSNFRILAFRFYDRIFPYIDSLRGTYRLYSFLEKSAISASKSLLEDTAEGFKYYYRGMDIEMTDAEHFRELLVYGRDVIRGYTMYRDVREEDVVLDVGAYPGEFTVYAAKKAKEVIALEPDSQNAEELRKNIELNSLDNVTIIEKGLWSENTRLLFNEEGNPGSDIDESGTSEIEVTTLDQLRKNLWIKFDFIKMDIEGAEIEALEGANRVMRRDKPYFAIATYHKIEGEYTSERVESILREKDYSAKTGFRDHKTTWGCNESSL